MTDHTVNLRTRIFSYTFLNRQAFFTFDNAVNHACYMENVFLAKKMNLSVDEKQLRMRNRFNNVIE